MIAPIALGPSRRFGHRPHRLSEAISFAASRPQHEALNETLVRLTAQAL